jgi:hypothetical protein
MDATKDKLILAHNSKDYRVATKAKWKSSKSD